MKRFFFIGRDEQNDICIQDKSDVISRSHAIIEVGKNGVYYLTDISLNGTYVNGHRVVKDQKIKVRRGDDISFAHFASLDWNLIPKSKSYLSIWLVSFAIMLLICVVVLLLVLGKDNKKNIGQYKESIVTYVEQGENDKDLVKKSKGKELLPQKPKAVDSLVKKKVTKKKAPESIEDKVIDAIF